MRNLLRCDPDSSIQRNALADPRRLEATPRPAENHVKIKNRTASVGASARRGAACSRRPAHATRLLWIRIACRGLYESRIECMLPPGRTAMPLRKSNRGFLRLSPNCRSACPFRGDARRCRSSMPRISSTYRTSQSTSSCRRRRSSGRFALRVGWRRVVAVLLARRASEGLKTLASASG